MIQDRLDVTLLLGRFGAGGVERVACILANGFAAQGLSTEIAVASRAGPTLELVNERVRIVQLGSRRGAIGRAISLLGAVPALAGHLRRRRPRVLLSPGNHTHVAAALAHRLSGGESRLVLKITNPILKARHGPVRRAARKRLYRWIFDRADRILVLSRHGFDQIAGISERAVPKTRFVHNPYVDQSALVRAAAPADPHPSEPPMVLAVGRLSRQKNYGMLLRAMARLRHIEWRLVVLGEGPQETALKEQASSLGIADRVRFEGFVKDPASYYARAHVLALSSNWEDLPAVVLEALSSGCPVVATACSDAIVAVLQEAQGGGLVPLGDEAAFADAIASAISSPPERSLFAGAQAYSFEAGVADHLDAIGFE